MTDTDSNIKIREHYSALGFTERIKAALTTIAPESQLLTVVHLAGFSTSEPGCFYTDIR